MATEAIGAGTARPPQQAPGAIQWARENLFNSISNTIISILLLSALVGGGWQIISWVLGTEGWFAVFNNLKLFLVGSYPFGELWRVQTSVWIVLALMGLSAGYWGGALRMVTVGLGGLLAILLLVTPFLPDNPDRVYTIGPLAFLLVSLAVLGGGYLLGQRGGSRLQWPLVAAWLLSFPATWILMNGFAGNEALPFVRTGLWGGLLVTILLTVVGIVASFPLGVLLALGRRSKLPVVRVASTIYIEAVRGVPLITVLFMASLMLPLFIDRASGWDGLIRSMVAVTLFSAAYLAENVRGGLQSLPNGQTEAAQALGLSYWQTTLFITLPQALRAVIPALVGQFISLFKDTTLVAIVGILDLLGIATAINAQPESLIPGGVWREVFFFLAVVYFIFSFAMSRVSLRIERDLGVGVR